MKLSELYKLLYVELVERYEIGWPLYMCFASDIFNAKDSETIIKDLRDHIGIAENIKGFLRHDEWFFSHDLKSRLKFIKKRIHQLKKEGK